MKRFGLIVGSAACLSLVGNVAFAQNADVTGKWTMTLTTPRGERVIHLDLMQEGTEITGTSQAEGQEGASEVTTTATATTSRSTCRWVAVAAVAVVVAAVAVAATRVRSLVWSTTTRCPVNFRLAAAVVAAVAAERSRGRRYATASPLTHCP